MKQRREKVYGYKQLMNLIICFFFPLLLLSQSDREMAIRILQDKRVENSTELNSYLRSPDWHERELALLALANIQDTSSVESITPLLNDDNPKVRSMAAFASGMIGNHRSAPALFRRLSIETNDGCIAELFNGIGMCGTENDLKKLIIQTESFKPAWNPHAANSVMRFANRRIKDAAATKYIVSLLTDRSSILAATYALMRINDTIIIKRNSDLISAQLNSQSPYIRMWTATMAGATGNVDVLKKLLIIAKQDKDWRVRVHAIRALRKEIAFKNDIIALFNHKNEHVALSAVSAYESMTENEVSFPDSSRFIVMLSSPKYTAAVKEGIRRIIGKKLGERALPSLGTWRTDDPFISAQRIRAFGETLSEKALTVIKEAVQQSKSTLVVIAGIEAFQTIARRSDDKVKKDFLKTAVMAFGRNDAGVSYTASVAFQDTSFSRELRRIYLSTLLLEYTKLNPATDLEPMVELMNVFAEIGDSSALPVIESGLSEQDKIIRTSSENAYRSITGNEAPIRFVKNPNGYAPFFKQKDLQLLSKYKRAEIVTSKGSITILFDAIAAPFTVLNFILLAEKKFYDGLPFHRVVSNFVIQGGDPLGNGSGGPNYTIRTEVHPRSKYRTGAVGMASAGKDTEGSQWFITHTPTPHLDFRYSVFGYTKDAAVVDKIMVGDRIVRVYLQE